MIRYRPGSRIATVWAIYEKGGAAAAEAECDRLGLAPATKKNWIGTWEREKARTEGRPTPRRANVAKQTVSKQRAKDAQQPVNQERADVDQKPKLPKRVAYTPKANIKVKWTKRPARLAHRGDQCSEIVWLDTGSRQTLPNDQIINLKGE